MNEPHDPRPLQTVNRLRLVVFIPVFVAVVGVLFLANKLSLRFRQIEEPPARDYPPSPPPTAGTPGRPLKAGTARPVDRPKATATSASTLHQRPGVPRAVAAAGVEPVESGPVASVASLPKSVSLVVGGVSHATLDLPPDGIVGRVFLRGTPPPEKEIPMDPTCGALPRARRPQTRFYVVGTNSGLADVFVVLRSVSSMQSEPPTSPVEIRQRGCEFLPYITAAQAGQVIRVFNDDPVMHNVHPTPDVEGNRERNVAQLPRALPLDFTFPKPELFLRFKCDVHPWMFAYVSVVEHPFFAVSGADGQFALLEPPPGDYAVRFYHRKAGDKLVPVKVQPGRRLVVNVTLDLANRDKSEATVTEE